MLPEMLPKIKPGGKVTLKQKARPEPRFRSYIGGNYRACVCCPLPGCVPAAPPPLLPPGVLQSW